MPSPCDDVPVHWDALRPEPNIPEGPPGRRHRTSPERGHRPELGGQSANDRPPRIHFPDPFRSHVAAAEHERFAQHKADAGQRRAGFSEVIAEHAFEFRNGDPVVAPEPMPGVVHPDEDRKDIRLEIDRVRQNPGIEIDHPVPADAAIQKCQPVGRTCGEQMRRRQLRIAVSKRPDARAGALFAVSSGIRDGIALKKNGLAGENQRRAAEWNVIAQG